MAVATIPTTLRIRPLTNIEEAIHINYVEQDKWLESNVKAAAGTFVSDVNDMEQKIVNQVRRHKIISGKKPGSLRKVTITSVKLKTHLLNAFFYMYLSGKNDARKEIEASLGKRVKVRGRSVFKEPVELIPSEALEEFGRRQLVSKAEFTKMVARERARAFTVAGLVEKDLINSARLLLSKAIDEGWTLAEFQRGLREANIKYTGTVYGTVAKKGQPITPYHAETILRTNFNTIYNRGRMNMMNDPDVIAFVPAYQYSAVLDARTRETHAAMDSRIYPRDDPIWDDWTPANGFSCRCMILPVTSNMTYTVSNPTRLQPDKGFGSGVT